MLSRYKRHRGEARMWTRRLSDADLGKWVRISRCNMVNEYAAKEINQESIHKATSQRQHLDRHDLHHQGRPWAVRQLLANQTTPSAIRWTGPASLL
jgi:demethoxyubiquinone hydroxylase (CLK1/Coq7/Cat5 family)